MSSRTKTRAFVLCILICGLAVSVGSRHVFASAETATTQIVGEARSAVISGYISVVDAEKAGANVTRLLVTLNKATALLSKAELALASARENGNYDIPYALASECQETLNGFDIEASILKSDAVRQGFSDFMIYVVGSILGTVVVVLGSCAIWIVLKKKIGEAGGVSDES